jgi:hypothetical protein
MFISEQEPGGLTGTFGQLPFAFKFSDVVKQQLNDVLLDALSPA